MKDISLVEVNEAFAVQYLAVEKELGLERAITNTNGGSIALGIRTLIKDDLHFIYFFIIYLKQGILRMKYF